MGIGQVTVDSAGSVSAPAVFPLVIPTNTGVERDHHNAPMTFALYPAEKALVVANGLGHISHVQAGTLFRTGLLAPSAGPTLAATGSGARATAVFDSTAYTLADGDYIILVSAGDRSGFEWRVYVTATSFAVSGIRTRFWQVLAGANTAATLDRVKEAVNNSGIDGNTYRSPSVDAGIQTVDHPASWADWITATTNTDTAQTFQSVAYGTGGNVYEADYVGGAGPTLGGSGDSFTGGVASSHSTTEPSSAKPPGPGERSYGHIYKRTVDRAISGLSPVTAFHQLDDGDVALSVLADPLSNQNEAIDAKTWFRTLQGGDEYHEGADVVVADTTDTDSQDDDAIGDHESYDPTIHRSYADGFVPRYRCIAEKDGRLFGAGHLLARSYAIGTASITNAVKTVVLSSTAHPTRYMEHRAFSVTTDAATKAQVYEIVAVDEANRTLYLDRDMEMATAAGLAYEIRDVRNPFLIGFSDPRRLNTWGPDNELDGVSSPDSEGVVALVSAFGSIVGFTRTGIWTLRGNDPDNYFLYHEYEGVGCVGPKAAKFAEGSLWFVDDDGLYRWQQGKLPTKISAPPQRDKTPDGVQGTINRINQTYIGGAVVHYAPQTRTLRFFVPLDSDCTNRHALVYDMASGAWSLDNLKIDVTECVSLADPNGAYQTIAGDAQGGLWQLDVGNSDGAFGFEPVNAITSSTRLTVTCSGAAFPTTGDTLKGVPVVFIDATGGFTYNTVASNTATVLTLARIEATAPTGTVVVGGIHGIIETGRFHLGDPARDKVMAFARVAFSPDSDGQFWFSYAANQADAAVASATTSGDLTLTDGEEQFWMRQRGRLLRWRIDVVEPGCDPAFLGVLLDLPRKEALSG